MPSVGLLECSQRRPLGVAREGLVHGAAMGPVRRAPDRYRVRWPARENIGVRALVREVEACIDLVLVERAFRSKPVGTEVIATGAVEQLPEPVERDDVLGVHDVPAHIQFGRGLGLSERSIARVPDRGHRSC